MPASAASRTTRSTRSAPTAGATAVTRGSVSATAATALPRALPPDAPAQRLPGDLVVWLLVLLELLTFGMLFVAFAGARLRDPALFAAGQATLDLNSGALNTVLLVSASACAARALHAVRASHSRAGARWLLAALAFAGRLWLVGRNTAPPAG